jgi:hypothetical protein
MCRSGLHTITTILDIIHRPVILKHNVSETEFCLRLQVEPIYLVPVDMAVSGGNSVGFA